MTQYTTDWLGHACTTRHGGTSAAAPLASGVFALVLSIRPDLTWRDLQHLVVQSATPITLEDTDWQEVAMGRKFNHKFGYGVMDGYRIIEAAKRHTLVNPQSSYVIPTQTINVDIPDTGNPLQNKFIVTESELVKRNFSRLEHVTVTVNIKHQRRGDIAVQLISPKGYRSDMLVSRPYDEDPVGFNDWTAMTVKHWYFEFLVSFERETYAHRDENPVGEWTLQVTDIHPNSRSGQWVDWSMTLWGESGIFKRETNGAPSAPAPPVENNTTVVSTAVSVTSFPSSTAAGAPIVTASPPTIPVATPSPIGLTTTSILFPSSIASHKSASDVGQDVTEDDTNGFAIFGGLLFLVILAVGAFSGYIIWRRIVKKRASAALGGNQEDPESYRSLDVGDEEDASSFAREQRGNGNSAQRSNSPPKMQEVLFETGPLNEDEDF